MNLSIDISASSSQTGSPSSPTSSLHSQLKAPNLTCSPQSSLIFESSPNSPHFVVQRNSLSTADTCPTTSEQSPSTNPFRLFSNPPFDPSAYLPLYNTSNLILRESFAHLYQTCLNFIEKQLNHKLDAFKQTIDQEFEQIQSRLDCVEQLSAAYKDKVPWLMANDKPNDNGESSNFMFHPNVVPHSQHSSAAAMHHLAPFYSTSDNCVPSMANKHDSKSNPFSPAWNSNNTNANANNKNCSTPMNVDEPLNLNSSSMLWTQWMANLIATTYSLNNNGSAILEKFQPPPLGLMGNKTLGNLDQMATKPKPSPVISSTTSNPTYQIANSTSTPIYTDIPNPSPPTWRQYSQSVRNRGSKSCRIRSKCFNSLSHSSGGLASSKFQSNYAFHQSNKSSSSPFANHINSRSNRKSNIHMFHSSQQQQQQWLQPTFVRISDSTDRLGTLKATDAASNIQTDSSLINPSSNHQTNGANNLVDRPVVILNQNEPREIFIGGVHTVPLPLWAYCKCLTMVRGEPHELGPRLCLRLLQSLFSLQYLVTHNYNGSGGKAPIDPTVMGAVLRQAQLQFGSGYFFTEPMALGKLRDYLNNAFRVMAFRQRKGERVRSPFWNEKGEPVHDLEAPVEFSNIMNIVVVQNSTDMEMNHSDTSGTNEMNTVMS